MTQVADVLPRDLPGGKDPLDAGVCAGGSAQKPQETAGWQGGVDLTGWM